MIGLLKSFLFTSCLIALASSQCCPPGYSSIPDACGCFREDSPVIQADSSLSCSESEIPVLGGGDMTEDEFKNIASAYQLIWTGAVKNGKKYYFDNGSTSSYFATQPWGKFFKAKTLSPECLGVNSAGTYVRQACDNQVTVVCTLEVTPRCPEAIPLPPVGMLLRNKPTWSADASSTYQNNLVNWGPSNTINGQISSSSTGIWHSRWGKYEYLQIDLNNEYPVSEILVEGRRDNHDERFEYFEARVGSVNSLSKEGLGGRLTQNAACGCNSGAGPRENYRFNCGGLIRGRFITIQQVKNTIIDLTAIAEVDVYVMAKATPMDKQNWVTRGFSARMGSLEPFGPFDSVVPGAPGQTTYQYLQVDLMSSSTVSAVSATFANGGLLEARMGEIDSLALESVGQPLMLNTLCEPSLLGEDEYFFRCPPTSARYVTIQMLDSGNGRNVLAMENVDVWAAIN